MNERTKEIIKLAILANGGDTHKKDWCKCDPEVGYSPCEYCAIFNGLNEARTLLSSLESKDKEIEGLKEQIHKNSLNTVRGLSGLEAK